jgi:antitoxin component YwqK of YwqJK toxin-antitoxin module
VKKIIVTALLCIASCALYAENTRKITATHYYEDNPKKEMTFFDDSGAELAKEFYHIDGRVMGVKGNIPDGDIFEYYPTDKLKSKASYKSNLLFEETQYYETGIKQSHTENEWAGRTLVKSEYVIYYPNGLKRQEIKMDAKGNGSSSLYYDTGELFEEAALKDAYRDGPVTRYYKNGVKMLSGFMKEDMLDGLVKEYDSKGNLTSKVLYKENEIIKDE